MSKDLFMELRAEELSAMYDNSFTKKEAVKTGFDLVKNAVDKGDVNTVDLATNLFRISEVFNSAVSEIKKHLPQEKVERFGVEFNFVNGRETPDYSQDEEYARLKSKLKERELLLKTALKSKDTIYDSEGVEVPKVPVNYGKGYITAKF